MTRYKAKAYYTAVTKEVNFEFELNEKVYEPDEFGARDQAYDILFDEMNVDSVEEIKLEEIK